VIPVFQSTSTIGVALYSISCLWIFIPKTYNFKSGSAALLLTLGILCLVPEIYVLRPIQTRMELFKTASYNLSSTGRGLSWFHSKSGSIMPKHTTKINMSRNQFHPHNDLLHVGLGLGIFGILIRSFFYFVTLFLFLKKSAPLPLVLFLAHIQITPDLMTIPAGLLFFFLLGQCLATYLSQNYHLKAKNDLSKNRWKVLACASVLLLALADLNYQWAHQNTITGKPITPVFMDTPSRQYNEIVSLIKVKNYSLALKKGISLYQACPHFQELDYLLAHCYINLGRTDSAIFSLKEKIKTDPYHLYSHLFLADILIRQKSYKKAKKCLEYTVELFPLNKSVQQKLGSLQSY
jgi:tetratricopeptide (TPR) repeat protein